MNKSIMLSILFIILAFSVSAEPFYEFDLVYSNGSYSYENLRIVYLEERPSIIEGGYLATINSIEDEELNVTFFDVPLTILYDSWDKNDEIISGGVINLTEKTVKLTLPYYENAKEIFILDKSFIRKLVIDVADFSRIETVDTNVEIENTEKTTSDNINKPSDSFNLFPLILAVIIIFVTLVILKIRRKKK